MARGGGSQEGEACIGSRWSQKSRCGAWMKMFLLLLTWYLNEDGVSLCWHDAWMKKMIFS